MKKIDGHGMNCLNMKFFKFHRGFVMTSNNFKKLFGMPPRKKETELTQEQFQEIVDYIKANEMKAMSTPFDNDSLVWMDELDIDVVKIASCSIDDWPLLEEVCKINKKIIISTAGADFDLLKKVYRLFKKNKRDFAFMHCVGEYPTPIENSNLNRFGRLSLIDEINLQF